MMIRALAVSTAVLTLFVPWTEAAKTADNPDFSGIWLLNAKDSDDPLDVMRERLDDLDRVPTRVLPGGSARPGGAWGSDPSRRLPGSGRKEAKGLRSPGEGTQRLEIDHADPRISIRFADGFERAFFTDGRAPSDDFEAGLLNLSGKWKKRELVFTAESPYGARVRENYTLSPDGNRLTVTIKRDATADAPGIVFKRVYDRAESWKSLNSDDAGAGSSPPG